MEIINFKSIKKYILKSDSDRIYLISRKHKLPQQGWKIHISCLPKDLISNIYKIIGFSYINNLSFKTQNNLHTAQGLVYGGVRYINVSKVITVYTSLKSLNKELEMVCNKLGRLVSAKYFPNVITDIQYKNSPMFLRYGGFSSSNFRFNVFVEKIYRIKNDKYYWVEDIRQNAYFKPDWIKIPTFLINKPIDNLLIRKEKVYEYQIPF